MKKGREKKEKNGRGEARNGRREQGEGTGQNYFSGK